MKTFLVIAIINKRGFFIWDTYEDYIVNANSVDEAKNMVLSNVLNIVNVDEVKEIRSEDAKALMAINITKQVKENITYLLTYP